MLSDDPLLEREADLERLEEMLDAARGGSGRVLVIEGEAGIGKSRLMQAARDRAAPGMTVLAARGGELERDFAYGLVRQLFEPVLHRLDQVDREQLLHGPAAPAATVLGYEGAAPPSGPDAGFAVQHALYWLTINISAARPLLLVVDDLHWADEASFRCLLHLAHWLEGLPVSIVAGWRRGEPAAREDLLAALRAEPHVEVLSPNPLSRDSCATVVRSRLGAEADPRFCDACCEFSGGNPFLLSELVARLVMDGVAPEAAAVPEITSLSPSGVSRNVLVRVSRLATHVTAFARALAVLENDADLRRVSALAELDEVTAADAAGQLAGAGIVASDAPLRFAHPILRTAIYEDLGPPARSLLHRRAARLLAVEQREDRAANHLMSAEPLGDPDVVRSLREAARRILAQGAPEGAVALLRRAVREPPPPEQQCLVVLELGTAERAAGDPAAPRTLRHALELASQPDAREQAARELAHALLFSGRVDEAVHMLEQVIAELPEAAHERRLRLELDLVTVGISSQAHARRIGERLAALAGGAAGNTAADRVLLAIFAALCTAQRRLTVEQAGPLLDRAWSKGQLLNDVGPGHMAVYYVIYGLSLTDRLQEAWQVSEEAVTAARATGSIGGLSAALVNRGRIAWWTGDLVQAEADSIDALHVASLARVELGKYFAVGHLVFALTARGDLAAAERALASHGMIEADPPLDMQSSVILQARAYLRLAQGRPSEARRDIDELFARATGRGAVTVSFSWRVLVLACLALGDVATAREVAERGLDSARAFGCPSDIGILLGARGLAEGGESGVAMLTEAAGLLAAGPRRLDTAEVLVDLGAALRRANHRAEARDPLRRGLDLAHSLGAGLLAQRAHDELRACGARPRRLLLNGPGALTARELRIAEMAADGKTNREIAQILFVTPKTVETHLGAAYRKLGIESRTQLRAALNQPAEAPVATTTSPLAPAPEAVPAHVTVLTILFTDIVGSSQRAAQLGDTRWRQLLARHDEAVREVVARHEGRVVKSLGDGFLVTFDSATRALHCAGEIRRRLLELGLEIRAGVHTGECSVAQGDVHGMTLHVAARILGTAEPGEILLSDTTRAIAAASGVGFVGRGPHRLRGIPGEWNLYAVGSPQPKMPGPGPRIPAGS